MAIVRKKPAAKLAAKLAPRTKALVLKPTGKGKPATKKPAAKATPKKRAATG